jgi:hypothetical protein
LFFFIVTVPSCTAQGSLQITEHEYPLIHFAEHISEENFNAERLLVIVLPLAEEDSTHKGVRYLTEELRIPGCWPIPVYNVSYK